MVLKGKAKQNLCQTKLMDQTRIEFFLTSRNADLWDVPLHLESNAIKTLTELLHETVGDKINGAENMSESTVEDPSVIWMWKMFKICGS